MIIVGLAFKISAAPFHMWTPDVYQGAPTPVTAFMSAATKVAAFVLTLRLLVTAFPGEDELWTIALAVIACISLAWGNLAALVQSDVKRMLAYSSISHAGFLLIPMAAGRSSGRRPPLLPHVVRGHERRLVRDRGHPRAGAPQPVTVNSSQASAGSARSSASQWPCSCSGSSGCPRPGFSWASSTSSRRRSIAAGRGSPSSAWSRPSISIYYYLGVVRAMFMQPPELRVAPAGGSPPRDLPLQAAVAAALVITIGTFVFADALTDIAADAVAFLPFPND